MRLTVKTRVLLLPYRVTPAEALDFSRRGFIDEAVLLMGKDWLTNAEDDDFVELTADELDDPDFLDDFAEATLELWPR